MKKVSLATCRVKGDLNVNNQKFVLSKYQYKNNFIFWTLINIQTSLYDNTHKTIEITHN